MTRQKQELNGNSTEKGQINSETLRYYAIFTPKWPVFSITLNLILLTIAVMTFEFWSLKDVASLKAAIAFTVGLSLHSGYSGALKALPIYHLFVFSATHLVYSTLIIQYYIVRAEKVLGPKKVALVYLANALVAPVITFGIVFLGKTWFGFAWAIMTTQAWSRNWYVGPSIAIWGCAGFVMKHEKKSLLYWLGFFGLIGIAIILKIVGLRNTSDWTSDIAHLVSFIGSAIVGSFVSKQSSSTTLDYSRYAMIVSNLLVVSMVVLLALFVSGLA